MTCLPNPFKRNRQSRDKKSSIPPCKPVPRKESDTPSTPTPPPPYEYNRLLDPLDEKWDEPTESNIPRLTMPHYDAPNTAVAYLIRAAEAVSASTVSKAQVAAMIPEARQVFLNAVKIARPDGEYIRDTDTGVVMSHCTVYPYDVSNPGAQRYALLEHAINQVNDCAEGERTVFYFGGAQVVIQAACEEQKEKVGKAAKKQSDFARMTRGKKASKMAGGTGA